MSEIDNIFIQVRARLNAKSIKLWEEPYYFDDIGVIEVEMERLSEDFSQALGITKSKCKCALEELQDNALRKLAARKEYEETGLATFKVRCIVSGEGTKNILEIKCALTDLVKELQIIVAQKLQLHDADEVRIIAGGKMLAANRTLEEQGIRNQQQLMAMVSTLSKTNGNKENLYKRINKIKTDVETIIDSKHQLLELENQDGEPIFLPPEENRALLFAMGYCEKARVALSLNNYDEALLLLLEADEKFSSCSSNILDAVDNYALLNLDIVWCYLCLKNVTQLPDAQRRLQICENSFLRSYGERFERLIALKGNACQERALIMRLHLLQGVVLFYQNQRDEAYQRFVLATTELNELKVSDVQLQMLVEMGFSVVDARLALRASAGDIDQAIHFIQERHEKLRAAREKSKQEREIQRDLAAQQKQENWVNPRSVCTLIEMGFERALAVEALRRSNNDLNYAITLLQTNTDELQAITSPTEVANENLVGQLGQLGFDSNMARIALETFQNNMDAAIDFLIKLCDSEEDLMKKIVRINELLNNEAENKPSTSSTASLANTLHTAKSVRSLLNRTLKKVNSEMKYFKAYARFNKDLLNNDQVYLDLPLIEEEKILNEYKSLLEK